MSAAKDEKVAKIHSDYSKQKQDQQLKQQKRRRGLYRRLSLFFCLALVFGILMGKTLFDQRAILQEKEDRKEVVAQELAKLKKEQQRLEEEIVKLNDDDYIAKIARRDYFMSEEDEIIFNMPDDSSSD
ncbi:FtsB family cell division protein [Sutcliffiella horikoshii]|uniref:Cell division protein DIVIC n=1 Tax=Sutcliffiella horikoshii TaxID=79883 RepID=A0A1Y0CI96_9BACI|nr:septum formation initiator family protein [Sutcliffiella horikoshii]ART74615.1 cell division protein DIVIC [Sutcliffiella horikoshii]TYS54484.1 septum formation initiator family protein [Sutcliffiella horikoshii]